MKKYFYSCILLASGVLLLSNSAGRGTVSGQGAAGAPGDGITCSSAGCHGSGGPFGAEMQISLTQNGEAVTEYRPGDTYDLAITVDATTGTPSRYGFQMTALIDNDNTAAGAFSNISANAKELTINDRAYLEHSGPSNSETFTATWTAPLQGTGAVTIYAAGIAANGNGGTSGDSGTLGSATIAEADLSSIKVLSTDEMSFSPNPANNFIFLDTKLNQNMVYSVLSIDGAKVASGNLENNSIDVSGLQKGLYLVVVNGDEFIYRQKIYKR